MIVEVLCFIYCTERYKKSLEKYENCDLTSGFLVVYDEHKENFHC